jgi:hypothetical protein
MEGTETGTETVPAHLLAGGRDLWQSVVAGWELSGHELAILLRACETVDTLDELQRAIDASGRMIGDKLNPALQEHRQQAILLSRLVATLRLPDPAEDDETEKRTRSAQRKAGARSPYSVARKV